MPAAHPHDAVAPPAALPRAPGWRDRVRALRARRHGVTFAGRATVGRGVRFDVTDGGRVAVGDGAVLGDGCRFHVRGGEVRVGDGAVLGERCVVTAHERVVVGAGCLLADEVVLADAGPRFDDVERPVRAQGLSTAPVVVGDGARVGPGAVLQCGAAVEPGASVGAHAVVAGDATTAASARPARDARAPRPGPSPPR